MISSAAVLTNQFYEWEQRGRGWQITRNSSDLEPGFEPFWGHFLESGDIIDDGKRAPWWSAGSPSGDHRAIVRLSNEPEAYPYQGASGALTIYTATLPKHFKQSAERIEQLLVMLSYRKSPISFELIASKETITLQWTTNDTDAAFCYSQLRVFFPEVAIVETLDDRVQAVIEDAPCIYTVDFGLAEECMRPLFQGSLDHDPYIPLFGILARLGVGEAVVIQILFSGVRNAWGESMLRAVTDDSGKQSFFLDAPEMPQLTNEKVSRPLFGVTVRAVTIADTMEDAATLLQHVATALVHASTSTTNALLPLGGEAYTVGTRLSDIILRETHRLGMLLNSRELATFVHFPNVASSQLIGSTRTTKQAPTELLNQAYVLGRNEHQGTSATVGISPFQRLRHIHIIGATGTGKSTLLKSLIMQDIQSGTGLMCLDPHGDLIDDIVGHIPKDRIHDVVLIDPSDSAFPIGLNILVAHTDNEKELLASDLVAMFRRFSTSWGDQMNSVFANAILAFMYNTTQYHLGDLRRFLIETPYRAHVLTTVTDPDIVYYWQTEYPILKGAAIGSILTRLDAFLRPRVIRNMVCQKHSLDVARLMDTNKIVLVKLSHGLLGTENSYLLGAFIVSKLQQIAMSRQLQSAQSRVPFFCYIDEFQHFVTPSMAAILSGARKYGLGLILSHQDMAQVSRYDPEIAGSVLANAGTRICFRLGDSDAKRLAEGFSSFITEDLQNLGTGEAIVRVNTMDCDCNVRVIPYSATTDTNYTDAIIEHSRNTYSVPMPPTLPVAGIVPEPIKETPPIHAVPDTPVPLTNAPSMEGAIEVREHRYLQTFIKALAEAHGYKASVEVPTPDGTGFVDVVLEKDGQQIAIEISVTTSPEWELHNIQKCLTAGYGHVVVCATQPAKLARIQKHLATHLAMHEQAKVRYIVSTEINTLFETAAAPAPTETIVKGYRVRVNYEPNASRQDMLHSIIKATKKP